MPLLRLLQSPAQFCLTLASLVKCTQFLIRLDFVQFEAPTEQTHSLGSVSQTLLTVRLLIGPADNKPPLRYEVAIDEGQFCDVFDMETGLAQMFG